MMGHRKLLTNKKQTAINDLWAYFKNNVGRFYVFSIIIGILCSISIVSSGYINEPTQQYNKIFLDPFYRASMTAGTNYTYTINVNPPDKVKSISSAIISFDVYISPTVNFNLWVNNIPCNTPLFTISTTYASAGQSRITFDCSNVINKAGVYTVKIKPTQQNTGASTGWLDLVYSNNPKGELTIHGTEYTNKQKAKVWLQLLNNNGTYINNGVCYTDIYTPDNEEYVERATMTNMNHDGIYYYDLDAPILEGVYPVIAVCYYEAGQTFKFPTNYFTNIGTYDSGAISDLELVDTNFLRFKESTVNPVRNISVGLNLTMANVCSNVSEALLTGISIRVVSRFDSVVNDDITISIYNYTSNSWLELPNKILEGASWKDVTNSFSLNNVTKVGFVNSTGSNLRIRFVDTSLTDGATSNLDLDYVSVSCDQLSNPSWQETRGSSEIHVSSNVIEPFYVETSCGSNEDDLDTSKCATFKNNMSYWNYSWGYIYDNVTVINNYQVDIDSQYNYETGLGQDCTGIIEIIENRNGTITDITDNLVLSSGTNENCIISLPVEMNYTERQIEFYITQDNYMKWEVERTVDFMNYLEESLTPFCDNVAVYNNLSYQVPIEGINLEELYSNRSEFLACYRIKDDIYFMTLYYNESKSVTTQGEYESYLQEARFYYPDLKAYTQLFNQTEVYKKIDKINFNQTDLTNYTLINEGVWNYNGTVNPNIISQFVNSIWSYTSTISSNILSSISNAIWSAPDRNLTYTTTFNQTDLTNYTKISEEVWDYQNRSLTTPFPEFNQTDLTNYTLIVERIWDYYNRTLTFYPVSNQSDQTNYTLINEGVWNYMNRTLTEFNVTNINYTQIVDDVWNYQSRYTHGEINS